MSIIERVDYKYTKKENLDLEIIGLQHFFATRPWESIKRDNRINFWVIIYIIEGQGYHCIDFQKYYYKSGDVIIVQKNQVHSFQINPDVEGYIIHINEPFFFRFKSADDDSFLEYFDKPFGSPVISVDASIESTNRTLIELIHKEYSNYTITSSYRLLSTLFQSFILSIKSTIPTNETIYNSRAYVNFCDFRRLVEDNYTYHKTVAEYSEMMNLSKKTINQSTRTVVGLSAKQYINNRILLEIKRYLSQGDLLNYEISDLLGFDEASNMSNFFKRYEGMSPKEFRVKRNKFNV